MRTFIGFGQQQYIGAPSCQAVKLAGISTQTIPLLFNWNSYGASSGKSNINVLVDLNGQPCIKLDYIKSVYIDNLGSDNPVYVYFPDTNYTVAAKPNSEGWYPAYTNSRVIWVVGENFVTGDIPTTFILLSNSAISPSVNVEQDTAISLWKSSPALTLGGETLTTSGFNSPALGDQSVQLFFNIATASPQIASLFPVKPSGFYYLTEIVLYGTILKSAAAAQLCTCAIQSSGIAGIFKSIAYTAFNNFTSGELYRVHGQFKLDATQQYQFVNNVQLLSGELQLDVSYTYSLN